MPITGKVLLLLMRLGRLFSRWVAAAIANRERKAELPALQHFNDQELKVTGVFRYRIGDSLAETTQAQMRRQRSERSGNKR
jgi:hypothetical protein